MSDKVTAQRVEKSNIEDRAYFWMCRLRDDDCSQAEHDEFLDWCKDPVNFRAFERAKQLGGELAVLSARPAMTALRQRILQQSTTDIAQTDVQSESLDEAEADEDPVIARKPEQSLKSEQVSASVHNIDATRRRRMAGWTKLSAGFAVAAALALFAVLPYFKDIHQTEIGEIKTLVLDDNTKVTLDTDTRIRIAFTDQQRKVILSRGQAFFEVAKNPQRPFVVDTGGDTVTAVGTAFSVRKSKSEFTVLLSEGIVDIAHEDDIKQHSDTDKVVRLQAGEQWLSKEGRKSALDDMDSRLSWMKGTLVFRSSPLKDVIAEVNRYSEKSVRLSDASLAESKIDAVFHVGKTEGFAIALKRMLNLKLDYDTQGNITLSK